MIHKFALIEEICYTSNDNVEFFNTIFISLIVLYLEYFS